MKIEKNVRARKRAGFSLIELLIVIGIIAILAGVMMATFGKSTDSARAAQCLTNLKHLAQAANAYAMQSDHYPLAGSREAIKLIVPDGIHYLPQRGWISWLDKNYPKNNSGTKISRSHQKMSTCPFFGTGNEHDALYALTNGVLWKSIGRSKTAYTCPEHVRYRASKAAGDKRPPSWSYVMSAKFGYDSSDGAKAVASADSYGVRYGSLARADRTLMFAELPLYDPDTKMAVDAELTGTKADCTLQYKATVNGRSYNDGWKGAPEEIGFVHKAGKGKYCAHVVFADCHTEKYIWGAKGVKRDELTVMLCEGLDVTFDGAGYRLATGGDEMNR
jgi:prepilin-type N-terminal cleavage/methylation domain-containing protein